MSPDIRATLTKKIGPLPVWVWLVIGGGGFMLARSFMSPDPEVSEENEHGALYDDERVPFDSDYMGWHGGGAPVVDEDAHSGEPLPVALPGGVALPPEWSWNPVTPPGTTPPPSETPNCGRRPRLAPAKIPQAAWAYLAKTRGKPAAWNALPKKTRTAILSRPWLLPWVRWYNCENPVRGGVRHPPIVYGARVASPVIPSEQMNGEGAMA